MKNLKNIILHPVASIKYASNKRKNNKKEREFTLKKVLTHPIASIKYALNKRKNSKKEKEFTLKKVLTHPIASIKYAINKRKKVKKEETSIKNTENDNLKRYLKNPADLEDIVVNPEINLNNSKEKSIDDITIKKNEEKQSVKYSKKVSWNINFCQFLDSTDLSKEEKEKLYEKANEVMNNYPEMQDKLIEDLINDKVKSNYPDIKAWIKRLELKAKLNNNEFELEKSKDNNEKGSKEIEIIDFDDINDDKKEEYGVSKEELMEARKDKKLSGIFNNVNEKIKKEKEDKKVIIESKEEYGVSKEVESALRKEVFEKYSQAELEKKVKELKSKILETKLSLELCSDYELKDKYRKKLAKRELKLSKLELKLRLYVEESIKFYEEYEKQNNNINIKDEIDTKAKERADYIKFWENADEAKLSNIQKYSDQEISDFMANPLNSKIGADQLKSLVLSNK